jgi:hypothetical protein
MVTVCLQPGKAQEALLTLHHLMSGQELFAELELNSRRHIVVKHYQLATVEVDRVTIHSFLSCHVADVLRTLLLSLN